MPLTPEQLLTTTRTVRRRLDLERPVPLDLVLSCLRTATQAPTGGNREDWRWLVLTDPGVRAEVAAVYCRAFADYRERQERTGRTPSALLDQAEHLARRLHRGPGLVLPCLRVPDGLPAGNQAGLWSSVLPAAWSYLLAARAAGLAAAWTTTHLAREDEVAAILGIPPGVRQAALLPTAYPVGGEFRPAARRPLTEVVHVNHWRVEVATPSAGSPQ